MSAPMPRLGNMPSLWRIRSIPIASVMLASALPALLPVIVQSPALPPFGLLMFLGWRLLHHELWPLWIGAPLGAFDDIMSGNPLGMAVFLWTAIMIATEIFDRRVLWRNYLHDWLIAVVACGFGLAGTIVLNKLSPSSAPVSLMLPQWLWSALLYPFIVRLIAVLDRWRMMA